MFRLSKATTSSRRRLLCLVSVNVCPEKNTLITLAAVLVNLEVSGETFFQRN